MARKLFIVSDLHLGSGHAEANPLEDFFADKQFRDFLKYIARHGHNNVELLILGDAFDFPQVMPLLGKKWPEPSEGTTQQQSVDRVKAIVGGHAVFFTALADFVKEGGTVRFLRGNHDVDLCWREVQQILQKEIVKPGARGELIFWPKHVYRVGPLYCEHGNQYSQENAHEDPDNPLVHDATGTERLERCWGTYFMDVFYNDIEADFPPIDNAEQMVRGALKAARSGGFVYTGRQLGRLIKLAAQGGLPLFGWVKSGLMGEDGHSDTKGEAVPTVRVESADDLAANLSDQELGNQILELLRDPVFRQEFEEEVDEVIVQVKGEDLAKTEQDSNRMMGLFTGRSAYQRAAAKILDEDGIQCVVFGHTHAPVDGNLPDQRAELPAGKRYFNSGSWTRCIDLTSDHNRDIPFDRLAAEGVFKSSLDYVEVTFEDDGTMEVELGSAGTTS